MRIRPFAGSDHTEPRIQALAFAGVGWGQREAPEPSGRLCLWLFRHRRIARRTHEHDGSLREHWQTSNYDLELEAGTRTFRLRLLPHHRRRLLEVD